MTQLHFGIGTPQQHVTYEEMLDVWQMADEEPLIEHMWLLDHLIAVTPQGPDPAGSCFESWTTLAALAAQTRRVRAGILVTDNAYRHPAVLARQAVTVDHLTQGRLIFGIGAGWFELEHTAYGIPYPSASARVKRLDEACTVLRLLWTEKLSSFNGAYYQLKEAPGEPKPVQQPYPPLLIGAGGDKMLHVVARHADIWGAISQNIEDFRQKSTTLDAYCRAIGRDPATIARHKVVIINPATVDWATTRAEMLDLVEAGVRHLTINVLAVPYPRDIVGLLVREVFTPLQEYAEALSR